MFAARPAGGRAYIAGPSPAAAGHLRHQEDAHPPDDRVLDARLAERCVAHQQETQILGGDVVVEGDVVAIGRPAVVVRPALRPAADRILTAQDEIDRLVERRPIARVALFQIDAEQELHRLRRAGVVKRGVVRIMLELLHAPRIRADRRVPAPRRVRPGEVVEIVPAAAAVLRGDQRLGDALRRAVIIFVMRRVISVEEQVAHGRRARRLAPDHRRPGLDLAPSARHVGEVGPDIAAMHGDAAHHELGRAAHRRLDLGARGRRRGRGGARDGG
jgi:hypothetical protein